MLQKKKNTEDTLYTPISVQRLPDDVYDLITEYEHWYNSIYEHGKWNIFEYLVHDKGSVIMYKIKGTLLREAGKKKTNEEMCLLIRTIAGEITKVEKCYKEKRTARTYHDFIFEGDINQIVRLSEQSNISAILRSKLVDPDNDAPYLELKLELDKPVEHHRYIGNDQAKIRIKEKYDHVIVHLRPNEFGDFRIASNYLFLKRQTNPSLNALLPNPNDAGMI